MSKGALPTMKGKMTLKFKVPDTSRKICVIDASVVIPRYHFQAWLLEQANVPCKKHWKPSKRSWDFPRRSYSHREVRENSAKSVVLKVVNLHVLQGSCNYTRPNILIAIAFVAFRVSDWLNKWGSLCYIAPYRDTCILCVQTFPMHVPMAANGESRDHGRQQRFRNMPSRSVYYSEALCLADAFLQRLAPYHSPHFCPAKHQE